MLFSTADVAQKALSHSPTFLLARRIQQMHFSRRSLQLWLPHDANSAYSAPGFFHKGSALTFGLIHIKFSLPLNIV